MKTQPYAKPLKGPCEEVYVSYKDGDVFVYKPRQNKPDQMTRLCLPADYANRKLAIWNQKYSKDRGNPWATPPGLFDQRELGLIAQTLINTGTSVTLHRVNQYGTPATIQQMLMGLANWNLDKAAKKFSFEFFLDNDLEETSPIEIYDDDEAFWGVFKGGTGSFDIAISEETIEKVKGTSSLKMAIGSGTYAYVGVSHDYTVPQDWSGKEYFCFYFYGVNSGNTWKWKIFDTDGDFYEQTFTDNFSGWKRFVWPFNTLTAIGTPNLASISRLELYTFPSATSITYLDRTLTDIGQWVQCEVFVPDQLNIAVNNIQLFSWDGTAYQRFYRWDAEEGTQRYAWDYLYFLDGTRAHEIVDKYYKIMDCFFIGQRGETKASIPGTGRTITYSSHPGCKKRIGFAIKMPPDDGQDSATSGISQCRLKMEVYYEGDLTVEDTWGDNHGTRHGAQPVTGKVGMALGFDGVDDYVEIPHSNVFNLTNLTLEAWIYIDSFRTNWPQIVTKLDTASWTGYGLCLVKATSKLRFDLGDGTPQYLDSVSTVVPGQWYHVVGTYDGSEQKIYINGALDASVSKAVTIAPNTHPIRMGCQAFALAYWFDGIIDEVRIYNRALTATEVQDLYNGKRITNGLVSEWSFEDDPRFGQTTYEFEKSTNQYYGLDNINDSWLALFNPEKNLLEYLILNRRPLGLEIVADPNENIHEIKFKLKKGTRIWLGELAHRDHDRDTDKDGVPDIFEEDYDPSIVLDIDFNNEDETQNIAHDRSPSHNNGTIYGAKWVDGKVGRALDFDGVDDCVRVTEFPELMGVNMTWEFWFNPALNLEYTGVSEALSAFLTRSRYPDFHYHGIRGMGSEWYVSGGIEFINFPRSYPAGTWNHIVWVKKELEISLYENGVFIGSGTLPAEPDKASGLDLYIGGNGWHGWMKGIIDEVRIYNRALSADEIKERYNFGKLKRVSVPRLVKKMGYAGW